MIQGKKIREKIGYEIRVVVLGHLQRGGSPTALDRILATRSGSAAVDLFLKGKWGNMVGSVSHQIKVFPLKYAWKGKKKIDLGFYHLSKVMAT
jgi:6-phosphofructokinase 1